MRASLRDPHIVDRLLRRFGDDSVRGYTLDIPCGTGRLRPTLERCEARYVGADRSSEMLRAHAHRRGVLIADAAALPFPDATFDAVVCVRLLHHLEHPGQRARLVAELARVARDLLVVSFWDRASWQAWRRRVGWRRSSHPDRRMAISRGELAELLASAGADVLAFRHSFRFVSPQAFVVARKRSCTRA